MTEPPKREKWRPTVGLIIFTVLASVATPRTDPARAAAG